MRSVFAIVKRLIASNKISFILTALVVLCATSSGEAVLSNGNYAWLLAVLHVVFFHMHERRIVVGFRVAISPRKTSSASSYFFILGT